MKKSVLLITSRSDMGGGPLHVRDLASGLKKNGYKVVIAAPLDGVFAKDFKEIATEFISIPHRRFSLFAYIKLLFFCFRNRVLWSHSHGLGALSYNWGLPTKKAHTFHGVHDGSSRLKYLIISLLLKGVMKRFFVSSSEKERALRVFGALSCCEDLVIANGVPIQEGMASMRLTPVLGVLSRLDKHKQVDHIVRALGQNEYYSLLIAGDGPEREALEELSESLGMKERVEFCGEVTAKDHFFRNIDILVSASKSEGLPYSVLEGMSFGRACLLSKVSGHVDLVDEKQLFRPGDQADFLFKLKALCENRVFVRVGESNKEKIEKDYALEKQIDLIIEHYR